VTDRTCDNCAHPDDELVLVRCVYVTPETWDTPSSIVVVEPPEVTPPVVEELPPVVEPPGAKRGSCDSRAK